MRDNRASLYDTSGPVPACFTQTKGRLRSRRHLRECTRPSYLSRVRLLQPAAPGSEYHADLACHNRPPRLSASSSLATPQYFNDSPRSLVALPICPRRQTSPGAAQLLSELHIFTNLELCLCRTLSHGPPSELTVSSFFAARTLHCESTRFSLSSRSGRDEHDSRLVQAHVAQSLITRPIAPDSLHRLLWHMPGSTHNE